MARRYPVSRWGLGAVPSGHEAVPARRGPLSPGAARPGPGAAAWNARRCAQGRGAWP